MVTVYGIKNCDTVAKACQWLEANHIPFMFHDIRRDGLTRANIKHWLSTLGPDTLINRRSTTWKSLPAQTQEKINDNAIDVLLEHPTLIKRPVIEHNAQLIAGFKADTYQQFFS